MKNLYDFNDWIDVCEHQKIGEILLQSGKINLIYLGMALDLQRFKSAQLGELLKEMNVISQDELSQALLIQAQIDLKIKEGGKNAV